MRACDLWLTTGTGRAGKKIVDNLQVTVKNVHVRLEYLDSRPMAAGVTLDSITVRTCDVNGKEVFVDNTESPSLAERLHKVLRVGRLGAYISSPQPEQQISRQLDSGRPLAELMAAPDHNLQYILAPVSASVQLTTGKAPDFPQAVCKIDISDLNVRLYQAQYEDTVAIVNRVMAASKTMLVPPSFLGYRPSVRPKKATRAWWCFALRASRDRAMYMQLYKRKEATAREFGAYPALGTVEENELDMLEYRLTTGQIMLFRGAIDAELTAEYQKLRVAQKEKKKNRGFFGSVFGGSSTNEAVANDEFELSAAEREELYRSVHEESVDIGKLGDEYVSIDVQLAIHDGSLTLGVEHDLVQAVVDITGALQIHPANNAKEISASIQSLKLIDCTSTTQLVSTLLGNIGLADGAKPFCRMGLQMFPRSRETKVQVFVPSATQVVYNPAVLGLVAQIFAGPKLATEITEFAGDAIARHVELAKEKAAAAYNSEDRWELTAEIQAPVVIIPQDCSSTQCPVIYVDLGRFLLGGGRYSSADPTADSSVRDEFADVKEYTQELFSDHLTLDIKEMQVVLSDYGAQDFLALLQSSDDNGRLLHRFNMACSLDIGSCSGATRMMADVRTTMVNIETSPSQIQQLLSFQPPKSQTREVSPQGVDAMHEKESRIPARMSSNALYFKSPGLVWNMVHNDRSPFMQASIRNLRAGLAISEQEMIGCFLLTSIQLQDSSSLAWLIKTDLESTADLLRVTVKKSGKNTVPLTAITVDVISMLTLEWHPTIVANLQAQVSDILQNQLVSSDSLPLADEIGQLERETSEMELSESDSMAALQAVINISAVQVSLVEKTTRQPLYTMAINNVAMKILDASSVPEEQHKRQHLQDLLGTTENVECGALHLDGSLGNLCVQDMSRPNSVCNEMVGLVDSSAGSLITVTFDKYGFVLAKARGYDSRTTIALSPMRFVVIPSAVQALVRYLEMGVLGAIMKRAEAKAGALAQQAYVTNNEISLAVKSPEIIFFPKDESSATRLEMMHCTSFTSKIV
jgi:hypothetical protein